MTTSGTPDVSVVLSVFNGAADLEATLDCLLSQEGCDFEVIAINDGSRDDSGASLDRRAATDARLRVIHQPNAGLTLALIRGCLEARAPLIARHDVGDTSLPGRLARQAAVLRAQPALAFVSCKYLLVGPGDEPLAEPSGSPGGSENLRNRDGSLVPFPHHGTVMFRKDTYLAAGGYRPEFYFAQDVDLWSRLIDQGDLGFVPEVLYQVKFDMGSITARHRPAQQALRALAAEARALRHAGQSDADVLSRARAIRPGGNLTPAPHTPRHRSEAQAAYFVGSCLADRGDQRARKYFEAAVRADPFHFRARLKLLRLAWAANRGAT